MIPPDFGALGTELFDAALQTVAIGVVATAIGVVLSVPLGLMAAVNCARR
ncbi:hypothetical protein [Nocardia fusca]|uniref:Uncharacterized protein n=1 Tax=Nocardia fusca TaxID=941183 RepID=A0ABV3FFT0_9NOCA